MATLGNFLKGSAAGCCLGFIFQPLQSRFSFWLGFGSRSVTRYKEALQRSFEIRTQKEVVKECTHVVAELRVCSLTQLLLRKRKKKKSSKTTNSPDLCQQNSLIFKNPMSKRPPCLSLECNVLAYAMFNLAEKCWFPLQ